MLRKVLFLDGRSGKNVDGQSEESAEFRRIGAAASRWS